MFETLLIANRGEIACRVQRTCRRMGIRTVAVFSDADRNALFVRAADVAVHIGPSPARESYLRAERILEAAQQTGAQAIHPGYGFLSENAAFAQAVRDAGLCFVGPPARAIAAMGSKDAAKALMVKAGVPVVPGYHGSAQDLATLRAEAERIGLPVLIKAVAGGGGKGMRRVDSWQEFAGALAAAQREAESSFGDARVLIEKYLLKSRHIEVQVFADRHAQVVHLFERDCSLQRRHQKVLEEAPAPGMWPGLRAAMGEAAVRAAQAIGYEGAGTVEFIADVAEGLRDDHFYFMEMNTRLQVEHPITEFITGLDLVEWQLRVAAGERLPLTQAQVPMRGHALEVRVYAEDPARDYLPQAGTLVHLRTPPESAHVRVDSGVVQGDAVSVFYDPMIAKLVVWDEDRPAALRRLRRALEQFEVAGLPTNLALLGAVASSPAFAEGDVHTAFLGQHAQLLGQRSPVTRELLVLACVGILEERKVMGLADAGDPYSPWADTRAFRINEDGYDVLVLKQSGQELEVAVRFARDLTVLSLPGGDVTVRDAGLNGALVHCTAQGKRLQATFVRHQQRVFAIAQGLTLELDQALSLFAGEDEASAGGAIKAPMPGKVTAVLVQEGERVSKGQPLVRLEAMKMEHTLGAVCDGQVSGLTARVGSQVEEGSTLLVVHSSEEA